MVLLLTNQVVGWGGLIISAYLGKKTGKKAFYAAGTAVYAISWGMLALGAYLAGPEGIALVKGLFKKYMFGTISAAVIIVVGAAVFHILKRRKGNNV